MKSFEGYVINFTCIDGFKDTMFCEGIEERDLNIDMMINSGDFVEVSYCRTYANGESGEIVNVISGNNVIEYIDAQEGIIMEAIRKGEIKKVTPNLYVAPGIIKETGAKCEIGYLKFNGIYEATHIFIEDQYVGDVHYCGDTICLMESCHYKSDDVEVSV